MLWALIWFLGMIVIISPDFSVTLSRIFGIQRGADFIIYSSIVVAYVIIFTLSNKLSNLESKLKELNTKISLKLSKENDA